MPKKLKKPQNQKALGILEKVPEFSTPALREEAARQIRRQLNESIARGLKEHSKKFEGVDRSRFNYQVSQEYSLLKLFDPKNRPVLFEALWKKLKNSPERKEIAHWDDAFAKKMLSNALKKKWLGRNLDGREKLLSDWAAKATRQLEGAEKNSVESELLAKIINYNIDPYYLKVLLRFPKKR